MLKKKTELSAAMRKSLFRAGNRPASPVATIMSGRKVKDIAINRYEIYSLLFTKKITEAKKINAVTASGVINLAKNKICDKNASGNQINCIVPDCQKKTKKNNIKIPKEEKIEIYFIA